MSSSLLAGHFLSKYFTCEAMLASVNVGDSDYSPGKTSTGRDVKKAGKSDGSRCQDCCYWPL